MWFESWFATKRVNTQEQTLSNKNWDALQFPLFQVTHLLIKQANPTKESFVGGYVLVTIATDTVHMSVTITCPKIGHRVFLRPFFETQQCVTPDTPSSRDAAPPKNYCNDFLTLLLAVLVFYIISF